MSNFKTAVISGVSRSTYARKLLVGASAGVLMAILPAASLAQAVPAECSPATATAGSTVNCETAAHGVIGPISTTVADLTLNIGSASVPTAVENGAGIAISMSGSGSQTLNLASGSSATGTAEGVFVRSRYADIAIVNAGDVYGGTDGISVLTGGDTVSITGGGSASGDDAGVQILGGNVSVVVDLASVGGTSGAGLSSDSSATTQSISVSGAATGGTHGIIVEAAGSGATSISAGSASGASGSGIYAYSTGSDLSISVAGAATGSDNGVAAFNLGSGSTYVSVGSASGTTGRGIVAVGSGTDLTVVSTGAVSGTYGVEAVSFGSGALTVNVGSATGTAGAGIYAFANAGSGVSVTSSGVSSGSTDGIRVTNTGTGSTTISTGGAVGGSGNGIFAYSGGSTTDMSIASTGAVVGATNGIYAENGGTGALTITGTSSTGYGGFGVYASNGGTSTSITMTGSVYGSSTGIHTYHLGSGAVTISAAGVVGGAGDGIHVWSGFSATGASVTTTGFVQGADDGIWLGHYGSGDVSLMANTSVASLAGSGLVIQAGSGTTNVRLSALGTVSGDLHGVSVDSSASGATTVSVDSVISTGWDAMYVSTAGTSSTITATGDVIGYAGGLFAYHTGSGQLSVTVEDVTGQNGVGLWATNVNGTGVDVTVTGTVTSASNGINISNYAGSASVTSGDVSASGAYGISVGNSGSGGVSVTTTGTVSGANMGIFVNSTSGDVSVSAENVSGTAAYGAAVLSYGGNVTGNFSGTATGGLSGLVVLNRGTGSTNVTLADAYGTARRGADVWSSASGTDLTVTSTGTVSGLGHGMRMVHYGSGAATLNTYGTVSRGLGSAIAAWNFSGTGMTINSSGLADGEYIGIYATNRSGALNITLADALANRNGAIGVTNTGTDLTINSTGTATSYGNYGGTGDGIFAGQYGSGALSITSNHIYTAGDGIDARVTATATSASITSTGDIAAGGIGVALRHYGSGDSYVTVNTVTAVSGAGVNVLTDESLLTASTIIANGDVSGASGIVLGSSGNSSITTYGNVVGTADVGIGAANTYGSGLTITAGGDVTGAVDGISGTLSGAGSSGMLTISAGNVTGTTGYGIVARTTMGDTGISVTSTGLVSGAATGVYVSQGGSGHASVNVNEVYSSAGFGIYGLNLGNISSPASSGLSITATGAISAYGTGVYARNFAPGDLTITTADITSGYGAGISAYNGAGFIAAEALGAEGSNLSAPLPEVSDLTINVTGNINAFEEGILAFNNGDGDLTINVTGNVTSADSVGIAAINGLGVFLPPQEGSLARAAGDGLSDLNITTSGDISGAVFGIYASNRTSGDLRITHTGNVDGGYVGILAVQLGEIPVFVQDHLAANKADLTAADGDGYADLAIQVTGNVTGGAVGIGAYSYGDGDLSISVTGDVEGTAGNGINAVHYGGFAPAPQEGSGLLSADGDAYNDLSINVVGTVTGGYSAIAAYNYGSGALTVSVTNANGYGGDSIYANNSAAGTDLSVTATGHVYGYYAGVDARNYGTGSTTIAVASVSSAYDDGLYIYNAGTNLDITATGTVSGYNDGIQAINVGTGATTVNAVSSTGAFDDGIWVYGAGTDIDVTATGHVSGYSDGVQVINTGSGSATINVATVYGFIGNGIEAYGAVSSTSLSVTASGLVESYYNDGIEVDHLGSGDLTVSTAAVTSTYAQGIDLYNGGTGSVSLTSTGAVTGYDGILIGNNGTGSVTVNVTDVTGNWQDGIRVSNSGTSVSVTSTGTVSGNSIGINLANLGSGAATINANNVSSTLGTGVLAVNLGTDLSITTGGTVTGYANGIIALNGGSGSGSVTANNVYSSVGPAIVALNSGLSTDLSVTTTGTVVGGQHGIYAVQSGSGALTISSAGVSSTASDTGDGYGPFGQYGAEIEDSLSYNGAGISAWNASGTDTVITDTGSISGFYTGITALHEGSGSVTVSANNVTARSTATGIYGYGFGDGFSSTGISVFNLGGTDLMITSTGHVEGEQTGIYALNEGSGALTIATSSVSSRDTAAPGVYLYGSSAISAVNRTGTDLSITTNGAIYGGSVGINTLQSGSGATSIATNDVVAGNWVGIFARGAGTDMAITAADSVYGGIAAIAGIHSGSGALSITATDVAANTGASGYYYGGFGVYASQYGGTGLSVSVSGDTSAEQFGVMARANNSGDISVTSTGDILAGTGVSTNSINSGTTTVSVGNVTAENGSGVSSFAYSASGTSDISITASGTVDAAYTGIIGRNTSTGGSVTITAVDVGGYYGHGVFAYSRSGSTSVTTTGDVTSEYGSGVTAHAGDTGSLTVSVVNSSAAQNGYGIYARHTGTGSTSISTAGDVSGYVGIQTLTGAGASLSVGSGSTVYGSSGVAIRTGTVYGGDASLTDDSITIAGTADGQVQTLGGADTVTLQDGATVTGLIALGDQDDTFNLNGGTIAAVRGGDGTDTANFNGAGRWLVNSGDASTDQFAEFEVYNFNAGTYTLSGVHTGLDAVNFNAGSHGLMGELHALATSVGAGASLNLFDGSDIFGSLSNAGTLMLGGSGIGSASVSGDFTQSAGAVLEMDVMGGVAHDQLSVGGDITLAGTLALSQDEIGLSTITLIDGSGSLTGSFDTVTGLLDGLLADQFIEYDTANADVNLGIAFTQASAISGLTPNQIEIANALTSALDGAPTGSVFGDLGLAVASTTDAGVLASALDELSPENTDGSIQMAFSMSGLFMNNILTMASGAETPAASIQVASLDGHSGWQNVDGARLWTSIQVFGAEQGAEGPNFGHESDGYEISIGGSRPTESGIHLGFAASLGQFDSESTGQGNDNVSTDLARFAATLAAPVNAMGEGLNGRIETGAAVTTGSNDIRTDLVLTSPDVAATHTTSSDFTMGTLSGRFVMSGSDGVAWGIQPYVMATVDFYDQEAFTLGAGQAYAMNVDGMELTRWTYTAGARMEHTLGERTDFALHGAVMHHSGDTQAEWAGQFVGAGATSNNGYVVSGQDIETQYLIEGGVNHQMENGFEFRASGFAEFGDVEVNGVRLTLSRDF